MNLFSIKCKFKKSISDLTKYFKKIGFIIFCHGSIKVMFVVI